MRFTQQNEWRFPKILVCRCEIPFHIKEAVNCDPTISSSSPLFCDTVRINNCDIGRILDILVQFIRTFIKIHSSRDTSSHASFSNMSRMQMGRPFNNNHSNRKCNIQNILKLIQDSIHSYSADTKKDLNHCAIFQNLPPMRNSLPQLYRTHIVCRLLHHFPSTPILLHREFAYKNLSAREHANFDSYRAEKLWKREFRIAAVLWCKL